MSAINERSTAVVRCLANYTCGLDIATIAAITGLSRDNVKSALRDMGQTNRRPRLVSCIGRGCYTLTGEGHKAAQTGVRRIPSRKPGDAPTRRQAQGATGVRAAAWSALRIKFTVTLDQVCSLIDNGTEPNVRTRVSRYFRALTNVGIIGIKRRGRETCYILVDNVGPLAPTTSKHGPAVTDPNSGRVLQPTRPVASDEGAA